MVEIYCKSLVKAIGKVLCKRMKHQLKPIKVMKNGLFWWSISTILDNKNDVLTDF